MTTTFRTSQQRTRAAVMQNDEARKLFRRDQQRRGLLAGTIDKREIALRAFARWLDRSLFDASRENVEAFLDTRNLGARARYTWISHLHCFYEWAIDEELTTEDPTAKIQRPKLRRAVPRPARSDQLEDAIKWATAEQRCWIVLAAYGGLRCQEIAGLRTEDVLDADRLIRVVYGKGGHERLLPLNPEVLDALRALPMPRSGFIFTKPMGGKYTPERLSNKFCAALADLGVHATPHQLRHWFGSELYAATRDLRVVQEAMGHASPTTTAIYTAFDRERMQSGVHGLSFTRREPPEPVPA